jgi:transcriptional regulator with XRE-family HTH domain
MTWRDRLEALLKDRNLSAVARACGMQPYRISQIVGKASIPNAIDALILCDYLGVTVEIVFGDDAVKQMGRALRFKAASPNQAAKQALVEALGEARRVRGSAPQAPAKAQGKGRKTG